MVDLDLRDGRGSFGAFGGSGNCVDQRCRAGCVLDVGTVLGDADIALVCYRRGGRYCVYQFLIIAWTRDATGEFRGGLLAIAAVLAVSGTIALKVRLESVER
jgi:hypothetical protein